MGIQWVVVNRLSSGMINNEIKHWSSSGNNVKCNFIFVDNCSKSMPFKRGDLQYISWKFTLMFPKRSRATSRQSPLIKTPTWAVLSKDLGEYWTSIISISLPLSSLIKKLDSISMLKLDSTSMLLRSSVNGWWSSALNWYVFKHGAHRAESTKLSIRSRETILLFQKFS